MNQRIRIVDFAVEQVPKKAKKRATIPCLYQVQNSLILGVFDQKFSTNTVSSGFVTRLVQDT